MTEPFHFTDSDTESNAKRRDPSEILDFQRVCEIDGGARGKRPGKLMIVRPLDKIKDWRETDPDMAWKTLVVADIAVLEGVPSMPDEFGQPLPPIAPGTIFRNQVIFPGMLCKAWRDQIGNTLIGVVFLGPNEKGRPPYLWRSLAKVKAATDLGGRFMIRFPNFLIPVPREPEAAAAAETWATDSWGNAAVPATPAPPRLADPWAQSQGHPAAHEQWVAQPPVSQPAPVSAPPQGHGYQQADPWAAAPAAPVVPAAAPPAQHPNTGMNTLEQMKLAAAQQGAQGQPQPEDPPF